MKYQLPQHIINSINKNQTSIGDNPALPPGEEDAFLLKLVKKEYDDLVNNLDGEDVKSELGGLITTCKKMESNVINNLEELCLKITNNIMPIPDDTIDIDVKIVNKIDAKEQRLTPEGIDDYEFDSIDDINTLTKDIYKRRFLNALICGASICYAENVDLYLSDLYHIHPELPNLYRKIMLYNNFLLYEEKDTLDSETNTEAGVVDVYLQSANNKVQIKSQGLIFPILLSETIKGFLELAISHGLPKSRKKADYIVKKSDFKLAENWDLRIGIVLWKRIEKMFSLIGCDIDDIGVNFFLMHLAKTPIDEFNKIMQEILLCTNKGKNILKDICETILLYKERDNFNQYITSMNQSSYQINDDEYYDPNELII